MDGPRKNKSICYVFSGTLIISAILAARHCATIDYMGNSNVPLHGIMMKNIYEKMTYCQGMKKIIFYKKKRCVGVTMDFLVDVIIMIAVHYFPLLHFTRICLF